MARIEKSGAYVEPVIETNIDSLMKLLEKKQAMGFAELAKELKWSIASLEKVGKSLENEGLIRLEYPSSFLQNPKVFFVKSLAQPVNVLEGGKIIDSYCFEDENILVENNKNSSVGEEAIDKERVLPFSGSFTSSCIIMYWPGL